MLVGQSLDAGLHKSPPPFANHLLMNTKAFSNLLA